ncbi:MAG: biotin--[acetyl-CoA-carboxylase] ligase [Clostridia bacterium]|nr:biotin--[acetyl-CoA-carboxylase] ligase [Clostridia bacterium]
MKLDIKRIEKQLNTSFLCKNIIYHEEIDSTQDEAKRLVKSQNVINGTYIVTDKQTQGKGTKDRKWYDKGHENICGTFVLIPNCHISKLETLTITIAECIIKAIKNLYGIQLQIKHPNDIMCNSKKMAGILTESITNKELVKYVFVGIGINVNQTIFQPEIENIATSLKKEYNQDFDREKIISEFFNIFEKTYIDMIK